MSDSHHSLIRHDRNPPLAVIELLKDTLIGTQGTLYQLLDTPTKIHHLISPHFFYLERNGKAIGNLTICERQVQLLNTKTHSNYIRYVAFSSIFQAGRKKSRGKSSIHDYFARLFASSNLNPKAPIFEKNFFWAYIDPQNSRSFNLNQLFGFVTIGQFQTYAFSRVRPKRKSVSRLANEEKEAVSTLIQQHYSNHLLFSFEHLFQNDNYYVLKEGDTLICGIQANPVHWKIKSLPGLSGKIMVKLGPFLPGIKKLINPSNHKFLACEGLFWKPGYEYAVQTLLEGVLAETAHHSLLIWTDIDHDQLTQLPVKWGFIQKNKSNEPVHIVARMNGYSAAEKTKIRQAPKYISGFDVT